MGKITIIQGPYYSLLFVSQVGTGDQLATTVGASSVNLRAYSLAREDGTIEVVLVNKDLSSAASVSVELGTTVGSAKAAYLLGPSAAATTGMTFAGSAVGLDGTWNPRTVYDVPMDGGRLTVVMPTVSAVLIRAR